MSSSAPSSTLAELYAGESARVRYTFETTGDGLAAARERSRLTDKVVAQLYRDLLSPDPAGPGNFCLLAVGGYGRQELFPYSDVDLLFLSESARISEPFRQPVAALARALWDLRLRVGHSARTLAECGRLHRDNLEFSMSLLDCRFLAGDQELFGRLRNEVLPELMARHGHDLVGDLLEVTRKRHEKHGSTIFHLEPNLKEAPGGLRDYHVSRWLALIRELDRSGRRVSAESQWPLPLRAPAVRAFEFLAAARSFLHYRQERDANVLTYELQDQAASLGIGHGSASARKADAQALAPADWMRAYFRHARSIDRLTAHLLDGAAPSRSSLYGLFQDWRSRLSSADFSLARGRIVPRRPAALADVGPVLSLFEMVARHKIELSHEAERWVEEALRVVADRTPAYPGTWEHLRRILVLPHAPEALRAMHRLGLLVAVFPEFRAIDALVVRDFYHRYTVDEHSFMTIQNLHELGVRPSPPSSASGAAAGAAAGERWEPNFAEVLAELEQPELLFFSLLFHDVGKGMPGGNHVRGSLEAMENIFPRLGIEPQDRETVCFLIQNHLEMSATFQRRDIFDPDVVRAFAEKIGTPERLKMLCLLTYADIKAVNPDALTPWKAEMLWRLYAATSNYLTRSLDQERVHGAGEAAAGAASYPASYLAKASRARSLLATSGLAAGAGEDFTAFLEGFPKRYLETRAPEEIAAHYRMARQLGDGPVQLTVQHLKHFYELTVLTADRPFLFASLTGALAAWGMNILKADAFSNSAGIVLDTFRFVDLFQTLALNPSEIGRFEQTVVDVVSGKVSVTALLSGRASPQKLPRAKVAVPTQIRFDDASSSTSTLLELITQDRPGLLYRVSSTLAELGCNIEVALIDTEGQRVIDVFYLTAAGAKLDSPRQEGIRQALLRKL